VASGATDVSMGLSSAAPSVAITYAAPTAEESTTTMHFGVQAPGTAGPAQILTVKNSGSAPLVVSRVVVGGSDPGDFVIGDRCQEPVAVGSSCEVGVRFYPQVAGARSATLTLSTNAASAPPAVALAGGATELLTCRPQVAANVGDTTAVATDVCTSKLVRGSVKLTATSTHASLVRGRVIFATGRTVRTSHGPSELLLGERRPVRPGTYTLILRQRHDRRWVTHRQPLILR
jgi:hypothetical protein